MSGPDLEIRLLGGLEVLRGGRPQTFPPSKKARALLAYLAATERAHSREKLCALLWEGVSDPRGELRWCLSRIRPLLDTEDARRIVSRRAAVRFERRGAEVDLAATRESVSAGPEAAPIAVLRRAAERFRGEFLEGLDLEDHHRYHAWLMGEREKARRLRISILAALTQRLWDRPEEALTYAFARLAVDPYVEDAHAAVVRLLGALGRTQDAMEQYERCRRLFVGELGTRPSSELERARREIGGGAGRTGATTSSGAEASRPTAAPPRPRRREPPPGELVGRRAERGVLQALASRAAAGGDPPFLLLSGEPGIGKTRLLQELRSAAEEDGARVLAGRAFETEALRPYGAWVDALRSLSDDEVPADLRGDLAALLPELGPRSPALAERSQLFDGVVRLLGALASDSAALVVVFDDIHWLDEASAALLHYAVRTAPDGHLLLACAARTAELSRNRPVDRLVRELRRAGRLETLEPTRLDADAVAALVNGVGGGADPERVFRESEGNPLFALEIARALAGGRDAIPATLEDRLEDRFERLDPPASDILPWTAALGRTIRVDVFGYLDAPVAEASVSGLEALERAGVLRPAGADAYDFTHDLLRHVAYRRISDPTRRMIHRRLAHAFDALGGRGPRSLAAEVAHHASRGGEDELAVRASIEAGNRFLAVFAFEEAADTAARGLRHVAALEEPERLRLHLELLDLYRHPGMIDRQPDGLDDEVVRLTEAAKRAGWPAEVRTGFRIIANIEYRRGDFQAATESILQAEAAGREADPATAARALGDAACCLALLERDLPRAEALVREAERLARGAGVEVLDVPLALGLLRHHDGDLDEAARLFGRALAIAERTQDYWWRCPCLSRMAMIELERGRTAAAIEVCERVATIARKTGEDSEAVFSDALRLLARRTAGEDVASSLEAALATLRALDTKWMTAYVQTSAAEIDLDRGDPAAARRRAEEALEMAEVVDRMSLGALSRSLIVRAARAQGDASAVHAYGTILRNDLRAADRLSARARRSVRRVADLLPTQTSTQ